MSGYRQTCIDPPDEYVVNISGRAVSSLGKAPVKIPT